MQRINSAEETITITIPIPIPIPMPMIAYLESYDRVPSKKTTHHQYIHYAVQ